MKPAFCKIKKYISPQKRAVLPEKYGLLLQSLYAGEWHKTEKKSKKIARIADAHVIFD